MWYFPYVLLRKVVFGTTLVPYFVQFFCTLFYVVNRIFFPVKPCRRSDRKRKFSVTDLTEKLDRKLRRNTESCRFVFRLTVWQLLEKHQSPLPRGFRKVHVLWALNFMKEYPTTRSMSSAFGGIDEDTVTKWVWTALDEVENV